MVHLLIVPLTRLPLLWLFKGIYLISLPGMFVLSHHTLPEFESRVVPPPELGVGFDLELLWNEGSYDSPQQLWRATSDYNLKV